MSAAAMFAWLAGLFALGDAALGADSMPRLDAEDARRVDAVVSDWLSTTAAPSVSVAIVKHGAIVFARAYGRARLEPALPATAASRYAIDSVTKEFTAAAILLLAEQGKLSLDTPLGTWFANLGEAARVTLRQALTHTSGIRDFWPQDFLPPEMLRPTTPTALIENWAMRPLDFAPGSEWQYSNTGYVLAGAVVERVSGNTLFDFIQQQIFTPLGMSQVAEYPYSQPGADPAGYTRYELGPVQAAPTEGSGWLFGSASLAMTAGDLARWDIGLMNESLLSAQSYAEEFAPVRLNSGATAPYGLGLDVEQSRGRLRIGHSGAGSGFLADNRVWPGDRTAIVVLTNNDWAAPSELSERLAFLILTPTPAEARALSVFESLQRGSIDRSLFTDNGNFYFTANALMASRIGLQGVGTVRRIELERESRRGGMITRRWKILCAGARLEAIERGYPGGKLEEFLITRRED